MSLSGLTKSIKYQQVKENNWICICKEFKEIYKDLRSIVWCQDLGNMCLLSVWNCVIAHLLLKELLFVKLPSSKGFQTYLWIFQYLCGYYLFGMSTTSEKFSDTQWKFQPTSVFFSVWLNKLLDCHQIVLFYEQNKHVCYPWILPVKTIRVPRQEELNLCFVGFKKNILHVGVMFMFNSLIKASWMSSK